MRKERWNRAMFVAAFIAAVGQLWSASVRDGQGILEDTYVRLDLLKHTEEYETQIVKVTEALYVAVGYALANTIFVLAPEGIIIVDTTETLSSARAIMTDFRKLVPEQPVKAIIYTHQHGDHNTGTKEFIDGQEIIPDIWSHHSLIDELSEFVTITGPVAYTRAIRQFGILLNKELPHFVNAGIGLKYSLDPSRNASPLLLPNKLLRLEELDVVLAGLSIRLMHIPGETDDHLGVWIPSMQAFLCGDNLYKTFPNVYAIRGTPVRSSLKWVASLDKIRILKPEYLLMSHSRPLIGPDVVYEVLTTYRDAIQLVHDQTIRFINHGYHRDEIAKIITIPPQMARHQYLQQFYGTVEWSSKAVFDGYLGWFSGYAEDLWPLSPTAQAEKTIKYAGGENVLLRKATCATKKGDYQWALELASMVYKLNSSNEEALFLRTEALKGLAGEMSSSNGRNYYLTSVLEDHKVFKLKANPLTKFAHHIKLEKLMKSLAYWVDGRKCGGVDLKLLFNVSDTLDLFLLHLRNGIIEVKAVKEQPTIFRAMVVLQSTVLREVLSHVKPSSYLYDANDVKIIGEKVFVKSFFGCLDRQI